MKAGRQRNISQAATSQSFWRMLSGSCNDAEEICATALVWLVSVDED
jgi:hypothetical protein